jgi:large subunit ribosomal protein L24
MNIKRDDNVIVISGKDKGKTGKVVKAFPQENKVIVSGVNMRKKHQRARRGGQKGQVIEVTHPIDVSNVRLAEAVKKASKAKKATKAEAKA